MCETLISDFFVNMLDRIARAQIVASPINARTELDQHGLVADPAANLAALPGIHIALLLGWLCRFPVCRMLPDDGNDLLARVYRLDRMRCRQTSYPTRILARRRWQNTGRITHDTSPAITSSEL